MGDAHIILAAPKLGAIKPLIQSEGIVIGVDKGALIALEEGIDLEVALGDFDSISLEERTRIFDHAQEVMSYPSVKDDTDAEIAFLYVMEDEKIDNVYVYNWYGGRVDHLHSLMMIVLQKRFKKLIPKLKFVSANNHISYYLPGEYTVNKIYEFDYLSFILMTEVKGLTLREVKYQLTNAEYDHPLALISNEFLSDKATFSFNEGIVAVVQSRDATE